MLGEASPARLHTSAQRCAGFQLPEPTVGVTVPRRALHNLYNWHDATCTHVEYSGLPTTQEWFHT
jgi:hypothetical protein